MSPHLQNIVYAPLGWALKLLARMPWWLLYAHSAVIYFLTYKVLHYRRDIVRNNLRECFPEKTEAERHAIEREYYHHFADYFIETIKLLHISDDEMRRRLVFHNVEWVDAMLQQGRSVVLYGAHYGNWEWITSITLHFKESSKDGHNLLGHVYQPLENAWFDRFFLQLRSRFYTRGIAQHHVLLEMIRCQRAGRHLVIGFIADQHPQPHDQDHVVRFLNHPTAIVTGPEGIARKLRCAVGYFDMTKTRRGHYECHMVPITEAAEQEPEGRITNRYAQLLERTIMRAPQYWLWTHKRWKRPVQYPPGFVDELHG